MSWDGQTATAVGSSHMVTLNTGEGRGSATSSSKGRSSCVDQQRKNRSLLELQQHLEEGVVAQPWMLSKLDTEEKWARKRMTYIEIKSVIERKLAHQKRGFLTDREVQETVAEMQDERLEEDLDSEMIAEEIKRLNKKIEKYNSKPVGSMTLDVEEGRVRLLFGQMNNMSTKEVRELKVPALKHIEKKYGTQIGVFNEIGDNFDNARRGVNFQNWMGDHGKSKCVMAYNKNDKQGGQMFQSTWRNGDQSHRSHDSILQEDHY